MVTGHQSQSGRLGFGSPFRGWPFCCASALARYLGQPFARSGPPRSAEACIRSLRGAALSLGGQQASEFRVHCGGYVGFGGRPSALVSILKNLLSRHGHSVSKLGSSFQTLDLRVSYGTPYLTAPAYTSVRVDV